MTLLTFLMPLFKTKDDGDDDGGHKMLSHFVSATRTGSTGRILKNQTYISTEKSAYDKLKSLMHPFVLRRKKSDVLAQLLPPKTYKLESLNYDESTREVYDSLISNHIKQKSRKAGGGGGGGGNDNDNDNYNYNDNEESSYANIFVALRKAANHPLLLRTRWKDRASIEALSATLYDCGYYGSDTTCTIEHVKAEVSEWRAKRRELIFTFGPLFFRPSLNKPLAKKMRCTKRCFQSHYKTHQLTFYRTAPACQMLRFRYPLHRARCDLRASQPLQ